jgi:hypothetical protein
LVRGFGLRETPSRPDSQGGLGSGEAALVGGLPAATVERVGGPASGHHPSSAQHDRFAVSNEHNKGYKMVQRTMARSAAGILVAGALLLTNPVTAGATAASGFTSTYNFDYILWGETHFHVTGNGRVTVALRGTSGPSYSVTVKIERETCGLWGCHWRENYVGGTCTRTLFVGTSTTCSFNPGNNSKAHRIVMTKRNDGVTIKGSVKVS